MKLNDEQAVTVERSLTLEERIELQAQEIQALQQENEELKTQAAVMREALKSIYYGPYQLHKGYVEILENALATDACKDYAKEVE